MSKFSYINYTAPQKAQFSGFKVEQTTFDKPMPDFIAPAKEVSNSITNLMNSWEKDMSNANWAFNAAFTPAKKDSATPAKSQNKISKPLSDEDYARMLQEEEFESAYGRKSTSLTELKNTVKQVENNYYSAMTQSDEAIARMLQEDEYDNDLAYALKLSQEESDLAYALQLSLESNYFGNNTYDFSGHTFDYFNSVAQAA